MLALPRICPAFPCLNPQPAIPDHVIHRMVGRGSYGEVWLGRNILGTWRALKVVRRDRFDSPRPFEREFHGIQRFEPVSRTHDGLVDVLQVGRNEEAGYFYYVMELADPRVPFPAEAGFDPAAYSPRTLASELEIRRRLSVVECALLFQRLADALGHLHRGGLVHRDIKPANIIFVGGEPKFADIGLVCGSDESDSCVGTEGFIPPEGSGRPTADIYSLGKVMYEAVTGRDRRSFPELPLDDPAVADDPGLAELNAVILRACDPDPARRHASATELAVELGQVAMGAPVRALRRRAVVASWIRRALAPVMVGLGLIGLVAFGVHWVGRSPAKAVGARRGPLDEARGARLDGRPGWRAEALRALRGAGGDSLVPGLRQEAVLALCTGDLNPIPFDPPGAAAPIVLDPDRGRYAVAEPGGRILFRSLADHRDVFLHDQEIEPLTQFLGFSSNGRWLAMIGAGNSLRFRRCDPGTGAWVWLARVHGANHAAFREDGSQVAYTFRFEGDSDRVLAVSSTDDMVRKVRVELPGRSGPMAWAPRGNRLAVLVEEPPGIALVDVESGRVESTLALHGLPTAVAWSRDPTRVYCGTRTGLWQVDWERREIVAIGTRSGGVASLSLDEARTLAAVCRTTGLIEILDLELGQSLAAIEATAESIELSPSGRTVVAYAAGRTRARTWEFGDPREFVHGTTAETGRPRVPLSGGGVLWRSAPEEEIRLPFASPITATNSSANGRSILGWLEDGRTIEWETARLADRLNGMGIGGGGPAATVGR